MPVFFVAPECVVPPAISITGDLLIHLRDSLRITIGEIVLFGDGAGHRYRAEITRISTQMMTGRIIEVLEQPPQRTPLVKIGQALLKGEKMEWIIQKVTELGVHTIVPLQTEQSIVQLKPDRIERQLARWRRIALEAAQQSEQWDVPAIAPPRTLATLLSHPLPSTVTLLLAERRVGKSLRDLDLPRELPSSILVLIGPEGGWSQGEIQVATQAGAVPITLGQHILRAETAAIATISILQSRLGSLE